MLLLLTGSWYTYGQYQRDWVRHYGRTLVSESRSIIEVSDGSLLVSGYTIREGSFRADAWLIKLDPLTGRKVWEKKYGEKDWDEVTAVVETSDHHLMVLGWTHNRKGKRTDTWLMRLDLDGKLIWEKFYGDKRWDEAFSIVEAKDGGFAIAACVNKRNENDDIHLFKIDKQGEVLWDTILGGDGRDKAHGIYSLRNGDILAVGYYSLTKEEKENGWAGRFSLDGDLIWEYKFGGEATDALHDAVELENGQIILVGFTRSHNEKHQADLWVVKLNADGQVIHEKTFGEHKFEKGRKIVQTRDGGFAIAGFTLSKGMGKADIWVLKLNKDLELEWEDTFGGGGYDVARTMIELDDGALVIAGKIDLLSTAAYLLVRYNRQNGPSD
ncbi:MAG: aryl-sulfate sulfotransferase [Flammeovirgaceae bacterium]